MPPLLLRLDADLLLLILERAGGSGLCSVACACKELTPLAHDDSLWMPLADSLPVSGPPYRGPALPMLAAERKRHSLAQHPLPLPRRSSARAVQMGVLEARSGGRRAVGVHAAHS